MEITQDLVKDYFEYKDGGLYWKKYRPGSQLGKRFGAKDRYRVGAFFGKRCKEHQLIWFYHYGKWSEQLDHRDQCKTNNEIDNLRETTTYLNGQNVTYPNQTSKQVGVGYHKRSGKWRARSWKNGKRYEIGSFKTEQEAIGAYKNFNDCRL